MMRTLLILIIIFSTQIATAQEKKGKPIPAAMLTHDYVPLLQGKKVGLVVNQTSMIDQVHLVDSLRSLGINIVKILCPEHGFRGNADAGELIKSSVDSSTGIPLISLYGKNKKPPEQDIKDLDILLFDIQDVGVRFYTYISTLHYVMEACAEQNKKLMILDRPNPNGHYIDGPIMEKEHQSFVGMHPIPIVHGMTIAEYALMINGQKWLKNKIQCELLIIEMKNYTHQSNYTLPVKPSPNLIDQDAVILYPSTCLMEGTTISVGRGTYSPFKVLGHPDLGNSFSYSFTPVPITGMSKEPPHANKVCYGIDLNDYVNDSTKALGKINLEWLIAFYKAYPDKDKFFIPYFEKLTGTSALRKQIIEGFTENEIRNSWSKGLREFRKTRSKYLLYE